MSVDDVIKLSKAGLSDDLIIQQIKKKGQRFDLSTDQLLQLKAAHVSERVIQVMIDPTKDTALSPAEKAGAAAPEHAGENNRPFPTTTEGKRAPTNSQAQLGVPSDPGMYVATANGCTKILGQIVTFKRTGSRLVSGVTVGIKTAKENVQLLGPHSQTVTDGKPVFYFIPAKQEGDAGVNSGDLVLIRLEEKKERRQFEVGAQGLWRASSGISITHQLQLLSSEEKQGVYKITPAVTLAKGEYALYLTRGEGMSPYVYDFSSTSGGQQAH
jgi:hypothetical protein